MPDETQNHTQRRRLLILTAEVAENAEDLKTPSADRFQHRTLVAAIKTKTADKRRWTQIFSDLERMEIRDNL